MFRFTRKKQVTFISGSFVISLLLVVAIVSYILPAPQQAHALPVHPNFNHFLSTHYNDDSQYDDNAPGDGSLSARIEQEQYDNRAYPATAVTYNQAMSAYGAFLSVSKHSTGKTSQYWHLVGPRTGNVPGPVTYTGQASTVSGRVTAIAVANNCNQDMCRVWVGAAGGGIWATTNGLATKPDWHSSSNGLASNAIGSIIVDPTDPTGSTLYVGTGEQNGSSDSEAGVGLYKSTNYGRSWRLVPSSVPVAKDRSIGAIAVDPVDPNHIYIGTDVARHGASSVNGGRFTPPHAPAVGLYESRDGGTTFSLAFSKTSDVVDPGSPNGNDFFRGGVSKIAFDRTNLRSRQTSRVYFSVFDYGLYRGDGKGKYEQVFASGGGGLVKNSAESRTEFALAPNGKQLRIYLGDADGTAANFYRVDDANVAATTLTDGTTNTGWIKLSNTTKGTSGFASYNYCDPQCSYDMPIASPAGQPDTVWIGGSMQYAEIFTKNAPSNGRTVQRSTDAGVGFTDMTNDTQTPPQGMHPDQHVIAFAPNNPDIAFLGSDGGLVRTSGSFADASSGCDTRSLTGADLTDCKSWLKVIPTQIFSLNDGLATIQFQSIAVNPQQPTSDIIGGSQDNGTWAFNARATQANQWFESVGGDGGQSVIDVGNPNIRMHTYYGPNGDVNFNGTDPNGWDNFSDPLNASKEAASFYVPLIGDPRVSGTMFVGLEHVWRTQDSGGSQAYLDLHCNEFTGDGKAPCGDWVTLGNAKLTDASYGNRVGSYVVAVSRAASDKSTLWAATRFGRLFITTNADASDPKAVTFTRLDTAAQPSRFISGITVDPNNPYHAFISYSGYDAYTPATPGHIFDVTYDPTTSKATWKDISNDLGDVPVTGIAYDNVTGDLYISSDFGVALLQPQSTTWVPAAPGLPMVAVYGLTLSNTGRVLYAATHGRGAWQLTLT